MLFMYSCSDNLLASIRSLLLPSLSSAFFRGLQTSTPDTRGFSKSYNQAAQVPSFEGDAQISAQPVDELQNGARFGLDDAFHHYLADRVPHTNRNAFLVHI